MPCEGAGAVSIGDADGSFGVRWASQASTTLIDQSSRPGMFMRGGSFHGLRAAWRRTVSGE